MFATPCSFAENPHGIVVHFVVFMVVMLSVITPPWSFVFGENIICSAMPNCVAKVIVNPSWHCSLFEKQKDIYCKSWDILLFCNTLKLEVELVPYCELSNCSLSFCYGIITSLFSNFILHELFMDPVLNGKVIKLICIALIILFTIEF